VTAVVHASTIPPQLDGPRRRRVSPQDGVTHPLVEAAQAGDTTAFARLYDLYHGPVFAYVLHRVGNGHLAEDLVADVFLRAFRALPSYSWQGRDLGAWLVTIARNRVADHYKSGRYKFEIPGVDADRDDSSDTSPEGRPEELVVDHFRNLALLTALKQLNPEQQDVLIHRFLKGRTVAETAVEMGKLDGAIKALQYRAVRSLARLLPAGMGADR
jgi:RNA polymerase sigma-70 factor (ECF subfamily)